MEIFGKDKAMKKKSTSALVLTVVAITVLAVPLLCTAADEQDQQKPRWSGARRGMRWTGPPDQMAERVMDRLRETDPEKAEQLERLRQEDPNMFKAELREVMREHFRQRRYEGAGPGERGEGPWSGGEPGERPDKGGRGRERGPRSMQERHREFIEWLETNYPEEANELANLRDKQGGRADYERRLGLCRRRYGRLFEATRENPELAKLLKEDFALKQERHKLIGKLRRGGDDNARKDLTEQLKQVVSKRFDLIVQRKQLEYEQLLKRLERLKLRVKESEAEVAQWKEEDFKSKSVEARLKELLGGKEDFKWE